MIRSASQLLWEAMNRPPGTRETAAGTQEMQCAACGYGHERMVRRDDALPRSSFSGYAELACQASEWICLPCSWAMEGKPPGTLRMWSALYDAAGDWLRVKKEKTRGGGRALLTRTHRVILDFLLSPPHGVWFCSIARSGKLHLIPYAAVNRGRGWWTVRLDRIVAATTTGEFRRTVGTHARLRRAGFTRTEIMERNPSTVRLAANMALWRESMEALGTARGRNVEEVSLHLLREEYRDEYCG